MKYIVGLMCAALTLGFVQPVAAQEVVTDEMIENADLTKGKRVFLRCAACHTLGEGERNKSGPNLWNLFGHEAGSREFPRYSRALSSADFIWGADELNAWLTKPKEFLPGTSMNFSGLAKEGQRIDVIAFIMNATGYEAASEEVDDDGNDEATEIDVEVEVEGSD